MSKATNGSMLRAMKITPWLVSAAAIALTTACGSSAAPTASVSTTPPAAPIVVSGIVRIPPIGLELMQGSNQSPCASPDGYTDIKPGVQVVAADENGKTVGLGSLQNGYFDIPPRTGPGWFQAARCTYAFKVSILRGSASFVSLTLGNGRRIQVAGSDLGNPVTLEIP